MAVLLTARGPSWLLLAAALPFFIMIVTSAPVLEDEQRHQLDTYSDDTGCYYNYQHYGEGDRIITNEPCLNCTCHNRMLMCYLRVCPFTKAIGSDCTVEKKADQCCPVITCPEVPVQLLSHQPPSTTMRPQSSSTAVGHRDTYGCTIDSEFFADGAQIPSDHNKPCELCYCIRNHTACVMQECTLNVEGCRPVYQDGVCCPVRYECDYPEDSTTTEAAGYGGGLILTTTTTMSPNLGCRYNDDEYADGALIHMDDKPCEHCYCMRGDIVCAVQECGTPLEKEGHNCTALPPQPGKCCPEMYQCDTGIEYVTDASFRMNRKQYGNTYDDSLSDPTFDDVSQVNDLVHQTEEKETLGEHNTSTAGETQTILEETKPIDDNPAHESNPSGVTLDAGSDQETVEMHEETGNFESSSQQNIETSTEKQSEEIATETIKEPETSINQDTETQETESQHQNDENMEKVPETVTAGVDLSIEQGNSATESEIKDSTDNTLSVDTTGNNEQQNEGDNVQSDPNEPTEQPEDSSATEGVTEQQEQQTDNESHDEKPAPPKPEAVEAEIDDMQHNAEHHPEQESDVIQSDGIESTSGHHDDEKPQDIDLSETEEIVTDPNIANEEQNLSSATEANIESHVSEAEDFKDPSTEAPISGSVTDTEEHESDSVDNENEMEIMHEVNEPVQKPEVDNLINENMPTHNIEDKPSNINDASTQHPTEQISEVTTNPETENTDNDNETATQNQETHDVKPDDSNAEQDAIQEHEGSIEPAKQPEQDINIPLDEQNSATQSSENTESPDYIKPVQQQSEIETSPVTDKTNTEEGVTEVEFDNGLEHESNSETQSQQMDETELPSMEHEVHPKPTQDEHLDVEQSTESDTNQHNIPSNTSDFTESEEQSAGSDSQNEDNISHDTTEQTTNEEVQPEIESSVSQEISESAVNEAENNVPITQNPESESTNDSENSTNSEVLLQPSSEGEHDNQVPDTKPEHDNQQPTSDESVQDMQEHSTDSSAPNTDDNTEEEKESTSNHNEDHSSAEQTGFENNASNVTGNTETVVNTEAEHEVNIQETLPEQMQTEDTTVDSVSAGEIVTETASISTSEEGLSNNDAENMEALHESSVTENEDSSDNLTENYDHEHTSGVVSTETPKPVFDEANASDSEQNIQLELTTEPQVTAANDNDLIGIDDGTTEQNNSNGEELPEVNTGNENTLHDISAIEENEASIINTQDDNSAEIHQDADNNSETQTVVTEQPEDLQTSTDKQENNDFENIQEVDQIGGNEATTESEAQHVTLGEEKPVETNLIFETTESSKPVADGVEPENHHDGLEMSTISEMVQHPEHETTASAANENSENNLQLTPVLSENVPSEIGQDHNIDNQKPEMGSHNDPQTSNDDIQHEPIEELSLEENDVPLSGVGAMHDVQTPNKQQENDDSTPMSIVEQVTSSPMPVDSDSLTHDFDEQKPQDQVAGGVALDAGESQKDPEQKPVSENEPESIHIQHENEHPIEIPVQDDKPVWTDAEQDEENKPETVNIDFQQHIPSIPGIHVPDSHPAMQDAEETNPDHFGDDMHLPVSQEPGFAEEPTHFKPGFIPGVSQSGIDDKPQENEHTDAPLTASSISSVDMHPDTESNDSSTDVPAEVEKHPEGKPESDISESSSEEVTEAGEEETSSESEIQELSATDKPSHDMTALDGGCVVDGAVFASGSPIEVANPCQESCVCEKGIVHCTLRPCPSPPSNNPNCMPMYRDGSCCPVYTCVDEAGQVIDTGSAVVANTELPVETETSTASSSHDSALNSEVQTESNNLEEQMTNVSQEPNESNNNVTYIPQAADDKETGQANEDTQTEEESDDSASKPVTEINELQEVAVTDVPQSSSEENNSQELATSAPENQTGSEAEEAEHHQTDEETSNNNILSVDDKEENPNTEHEFVVEPVVLDMADHEDTDLQQVDIATSTPVGTNDHLDPVQISHENEITMEHNEIVPMQDSNNIPTLGTEGSLKPEVDAVQETSTDLNIPENAEESSTDKPNDEEKPLAQSETEIVQSDQNEQEHNINPELDVSHPVSDSTELPDTQNQQMTDILTSNEQNLTEPPQEDAGSSDIESEVESQNQEQHIPDVVSSDVLPTSSPDIYEELVSDQVNTQQGEYEKDSTSQPDISVTHSQEEVIMTESPISQEDVTEAAKEPQFEHVPEQPLTETGEGVALNADDEDVKPTTEIHSDLVENQQTNVHEHEVDQKPEVSQDDTQAPVSDHEESHLPDIISPNPEHELEAPVHHEQEIKPETEESTEEIVTETPVHHVQVEEQKPESDQPATGGESQTSGQELESQYNPDTEQPTQEVATEAPTHHEHEEGTMPDSDNLIQEISTELPALQEQEVEHKPESDQSVSDVDSEAPIKVQETQENSEVEQHGQEVITEAPAQNETEEEHEPENEEPTQELITEAPVYHGQDVEHNVQTEDSTQEFATEEPAHHDQEVEHKPESDQPASEGESQAPGQELESHFNPDTEQPSQEVATEAPTHHEHEEGTMPESDNLTQDLSTEIPALQEQEVEHKPELDQFVSDVDSDAPIHEQETQNNSEVEQLGQEVDTEAPVQNETEGVHKPENEESTSEHATQEPAHHDQEVDHKPENEESTSEYATEEPAHHNQEVDHKPENEESTSEHETEEPAHHDQEVEHKPESDQSVSEGDSQVPVHEQETQNEPNKEQPGEEVSTESPTHPEHEAEHRPENEESPQELVTEVPVYHDQEAEQKPQTDDSTQELVGETPVHPEHEDEHKPETEESTQEFATETPVHHVDEVEHKPDIDLSTTEVGTEEPAHHEQETENKPESAIESESHSPDQEQEIQHKPDAEQQGQEVATEAPAHNDQEEVYKPVSEQSISDEESQTPIHHEQEVEQKPDIPQYPDPIFTDEDDDMGGFPGSAPEPGTDFMPPMPSYEDEDQGAAFGPGTCRYGGKVYVSAQQIPRDDPCDFCFCFRSDIICLQQSCPPPIKGCHEEAIDGFCCPRYECPVPMGIMNSTTTTTTTTTLPPDLISSYIYGRRESSGCLVQGTLYRKDEEITTASGPCLECRCGGDSKMKCEPKACSPQPMLRKMIEAVSLRR